VTAVLRPYQVEAQQETRRLIREGIRRILTVAPTGAGKTVYGASILAGAVAKGNPVVFLAHRRELLSQTVEKLIDAGLREDDVGVIQAGRTGRPNALVQVCSIDTLRARGTAPPATIVMTDEAHRALAKTYLDVSALYPQAVHIGLTATPQRTDGQGMKAAYDRIVRVSSPSQLIAEGFLVKPTIYSHPISPDTSSTKRVAGDFDPDELLEQVLKPRLMGAIIDHWHQHAAGRQTVAFGVNIAHSQALVEQWRASGVTAEHIDGQMHPRDRDAVLARFKAGTTTVLSNVDVLAEGWDAPWCKVLVSARPTLSLVRFIQWCGRIMRPYQGLEALVLDHAGNAMRHGSPSSDREWSLEGRPKKLKGAVELVLGTKVCPACYAVVASEDEECDQCEYRFQPKRGTEHVDGALELVDEATIAAVVAARSKGAAGANRRIELTPEMRVDYEKILRRAAYSGRSVGSAGFEFKRKHGAWPANARILEERFFPPARAPQ
jgi:superfamily II DNA or RNA helicase